MTYILILALTYSAGPMTIVPTEYTDIARCREAGMSFQKQVDGYGNSPIFACIPSSKNP